MSRRLVMVVREKGKPTGVNVYQDIRNPQRFSVGASTYPLSAARWRYGRDVVKSIAKEPKKFFSNG